MILVRVERLPAEAACMAILNEGRPPWDRKEHLLDEIRRQLAAQRGEKNPKPNPERQAPTAPDPSRVLRLNAARARARDRRRKIEAGIIA